MVPETDLCTQIVAGQLDQGTGSGPHNGASAELQLSTVTKHNLLIFRNADSRRLQEAVARGGGIVAGGLEVFLVHSNSSMPDLYTPPPLSE